MNLLEFFQQLIESVKVGWPPINSQDAFEEGQAVHEIVKENLIVDLSSNLQFSFCFLKEFLQMTLCNVAQMTQSMLLK